ncbi:hypothetical protein GWI33_011693 [Rhynchophorus ferrugineus]|uniref:Uncharacterized protein n=1 Tax=Rhynchophorus ferrugineus TaxID=354439 RepID=A0A834IB99_RHYFE|nr:hypothetical protein GWI33_011693 [Rhynchophorus ferrugineus]
MAGAMQDKKHKNRTRRKPIGGQETRAAGNGGRGVGGRKWYHKALQPKAYNTVEIEPGIFTYVEESDSKKATYSLTTLCLDQVP